MPWHSCYPDPRECPGILVIPIPENRMMNLPFRETILRELKTRILAAGYLDNH
jgi:hypothetical protein